MSIYKGTQLISGVATPIEPTRNIGQIIPSLLPLTDAGLHLLDGEVVVGNGIYKAFVEYISKLDLTASYFTTEANWQASVEQYGVCGKFVYDADANTVRLPKVTGHIEGTLDANALGDLVEAGLPNITGVIHMDHSGVSGAFYNAGSVAGEATAGGAGSADTKVTLDASRSSSVYGNSNTVQTQSILGYMYIVVATGTKTNIEVDIDNVVTDLNQKVNKSDMVEVPTIVEVSDSSLMPSWYRVYSDGWCEQGGYSTANGNTTLLKPYIDTNFNVVVTMRSSTNPTTTQGNPAGAVINNATIFVTAGGSATAYWQTKGYIS